MKYLEAQKDGKSPVEPFPKEENKMQTGTRSDQKLDPKNPESLVSGSRRGGAGTTGAPSASVQKLATELHVDLTTVKGTGDKGAITEQDVRTASEHKASGASGSAQPK